MKNKKEVFKKIIGISNELIMPGEAFYTVPKFEVTYDHGYYGQTVTNLCLKHVSLIR